MIIVDLVLFTIFELFNGMVIVFHFNNDFLEIL